MNNQTTDKIRSINNIALSFSEKRNKEEIRKLDQNTEEIRKIKQIYEQNRQN